MALQRRQMARTFGSAAAVVQRVTLDEHLQEVQKIAIGSARWDDSFEESLANLGSTVAMILQAYQERKARGAPSGTRPEYNQIEALKLLQDNFEQDPDTPAENWRQYIVVLDSGGRVSKSLMQVYEYCLGKPVNHPGAGSLGGLKPDGQGGATGRPHFHPDIVKGLPTKPGQHRRHIIAWHTLLAFINKVAGALGAKAFELLAQRLAELEHIGDARLATARQLAEKVPGADKDAQVLLCALYVMNSNPKNLWVGPGKENSGINTGRIAILNEMGKWRVTEDMVLGVDAWGSASNETTVGQAKLRAHELGASLLEHALEHLASDFDVPAEEVRGTPIGTFALKVFYGRVLKGRHAAGVSDESGEASSTFAGTEQSVLEQARSSIDSWIVSNLDYDVGYDEDRPQEILEERADIVGAIKGIAAVMKQQLHEIDASEVKSVLDALLA